MCAAQSSYLAALLGLIAGSEVDDNPGREF